MISFAPRVDLEDFTRNEEFEKFISFLEANPDAHLFCDENVQKAIASITHVETVKFLGKYPLTVVCSNLVPEGTLIALNPPQLLGGRHGRQRTQTPR